MGVVYEYPSLFVKGSRNPPFCTVKNGYYETSQEKTSEFGYAIIEDSLEKVIDINGSSVKEDYCLEIPWLGKVLKVAKGAPLILIEISAVQVFLVKREGDSIKKGEILAHIITSKSGSRSIRAYSDGVIVFIGSISLSNPEVYVVAVAECDRVKWFRRN
ncbi:MAG: DUF2118 domain-containing protein [Desulfurococcales archaeon]|nr:DUF2118 domain-containing protein [Desulfurococcales archaeon]